MKKIELNIPFIPPSINRLYFNNRYTGGRSLSKEGEIFKRRVKDYIVQNYFELLNQLNPKSLFSITIIFFLPIDDVFTKSFGKTAKSPYKKKDLGNMEKVIIDCLKDFVMDDDCQIFKETLIKVPSILYRGMNIVIQEHSLIALRSLYGYESDLSSKEFITLTDNIHNKIEEFKLAGPTES